MAEEIIPDPLSEEYDDDAISETSSYSDISLSTNFFQWENGRRYPGFGREGAYLFPNDQIEGERLELQHYIFLIILNGKLFRAPIDPRRVLDLGTGTGEWAIDVADQFPNAKVKGVDLSPIQPPWVPRNLVFEVDDIEDDWLKPRTPYDLIHLRMMVGTASDWPKLLKQAYDNLRPGGYIETNEIDVHLRCDDDSLKPDSQWAKWQKLHMESFTDIGKFTNLQPYMRQWLEDAGFTDINEKVVKVPVGTWPADIRLKELGRYMMENCVQAVQGLTLAIFTRHLGYTANEVEATVSLVRQEMRNPKIHCYYNLYVLTRIFAETNPSQST